MEALMVERVNASLCLYLYRNAIFICERLCAEYPNENNFQLMANCYLRNNQAYRAYHMLKGAQLPHSRYLFAQACFHMGHFREAEAALCPVNEPNSEVPNGAAGHYLLGLIYRYTDRSKLAIEHFVQALSLDPLLWTAYEELCVLGADKEAAEAYGDSVHLRLHQQRIQLELSSVPSVSDDRCMTSSRSPYSSDASPRHIRHLHSSNNGDMYASYPPSAMPGNIPLQGSVLAVNLTSYNTPSPMPSQASVLGPPPINRNVQAQPVSTGDVSPRSSLNALGHRRKLMDEGKLRKSNRTSSTRAAYSQVSGRLFSDSGPRRSSRLAGEAAGQSSTSSLPTGNNGISSKVTGVSTSRGGSTNQQRSGNVRKSHLHVSESISDDGKKYDGFDDSGSEDMNNPTQRNGPNTNEEEYRNRARSNSHSSRVTEGLLELIELLRLFGEAFRHICMYRCKEAIQAFSKLPHHHYATGWVLGQVGKAHFEAGDFNESERAFSWARQVSPYYLEGMDGYSTLLYHIKDEMKLSYLAQELNSIDRLSPEAWCALGNCYSLQKDHETALKTFQRAIQLDSNFCYAYTLCGHEYVAMEEFENGISSYRNALRINPRHYNAWYGLGVIYLRQEKYGFAEYHFRTGYQINPYSSVLLCYMGMSLHALKRSEEALDVLERASAADRRNPLPRYEKAGVLFSLERYDEALEELEKLKEVAPTESTVYFLTAKIYKRINMPDLSMHYCGVAADMKPSAAESAAIKSFMEKLNVPDDVENHL